METSKILLYNSRKASSTKIWILFIFLGWSYGSLDKIGLQILYYITLGGLGFWTFVRLFTLNGDIKEYNVEIARRIGLTPEECNMIGVF
jgi:hypothetical protein